MKENIDPMPGSVACHPVVLPVKTLCSPLTLKQNAGRVFAEYWENCSWGGPIKSVSNECVCVSTEPAVPVAMILFEFGLLDFGSIRGCFFHVPCSLMECQDSQTCSLCPGLSRPQPKSLSVPLDRIKLWSLHNQMLIIKRCLFHTRASQALLCCPAVAQKLYKVNTENYYHMTRFLWSVSSCFSVKSYTISKDHFFWNKYSPFQMLSFLLNKLASVSI